MDIPFPSDAMTREAADEVVEFALMAFHPDHLHWDARTNAAIAAYAWNVDAPSEEILAELTSGCDPRAERLHRQLLEARRTRFARCRCLVLDLETTIEDGELVFWFRLTWNGGATYRPCRIVVDVPREEPWASQHA